MRLIRRQRALTLDQLAEEVGLSKGHLSRFERGEKTLSVSALMRLAKALGVSVATLLGERPDEELVHVVRAGDRTTRESMRASEGGYRFAPLSRSQDATTSAFIVRLDRHTVMNNDAWHAGDELLFVVSGSIEVELPMKSVLLRAGDFAQFPGKVHHRLRGLDEDAEVLIVVTGVTLPRHGPTA